MEGRFSLRRFAQAAGILSLIAVANFIRAVITAKLFAITLGPSAVGILAQLFNFSALMAQLLPLGLTTGVTKQIAAHIKDQSQVNRIISTSSIIGFASGMAGAILLTPFSPQIAAGLTGRTSYTLPVLFLIWSFPLYNLSGIFFNHLQGLSAIDRLTRAAVITAAFAVVILVPLTLAYGLTGAIFSVLVTSFAQTVIYLIELWRAYKARAWRFARIELSRPVALQLFRLGWVLLVSSVVIWASILSVRTIVLHVLGDYDNGLYQVVFGLSTQYLAIFIAWMGAYVFPRLASQSSNWHVASLLNSGVRANLAIMVPILIVSVALRDPLIRIFYAPAFTAAAWMIPIQVLGDYMRILGWSYAVALFAVGRPGSHLIVIATQAISWVALTAVLVPTIGLAGVPIAYSASFVSYPLLGIPLVRRWLGSGPDRVAWGLIAVGVVCILTANLPYFLGLIAVPVMPLLVYVINRRELGRPDQMKPASQESAPSAITQ